MIWTVSDRGPNFTCDEAKQIAGVKPDICDDVRNGRIYPAPEYAPSIYRVLILDDGTFRITDVITLKDRDGRPLNGMPNPLTHGHDRDPDRRPRRDAANRTCTASTPKAWCGSPTARSGSATRTGLRSRISRPTVA